MSFMDDISYTSRSQPTIHRLIFRTEDKKNLQDIQTVEETTSGVIVVQIGKKIVDSTIKFIYAPQTHIFHCYSW